MAYVKWNVNKLGKANEELRETLSRLEVLSDNISEIAERFDPRLLGDDEIKRALRAAAKRANEDAYRLRYERDALSEAIEIYSGAERKTLAAAESLPGSVVERGLIFDDWFSDLLR
ncbi:MAG: hypothetical protein LBL35_07390 [Clostridiales bacterium]|jgi:uncharacterized protein YqeY|nr:hypothetical protein [Clostridiales bacterium]